MYVSMKGNEPLQEYSFGNSTGTSRMPSWIFKASERVAGTIHRTSSRVRALQALTGKGERQWLSKSWSQETPDATLFFPFR